MTYLTVYDIAGDGIGLQFPLIGLGLILVGAVLRWGFRKSGLFSYPVMVIGAGVILAAGAVSLWDYQRVTQAVADGQARQVEGLIRDWRLTRSRGVRIGSTSRFTYTYHERFSVRDVDFMIEWDSLEAGFKNRGSSQDKPTVRLASGMPARIEYLRVGKPDRPPRIVRLELAPEDWRATASPAERLAYARELAQQAPAPVPATPLLPGRVTDTAGVLSAEQKAHLEFRLADFEQTSGHKLLVSTVLSLGGEDIAVYASRLATELGLGQAGQDDSVLLLVAPSERRVRIAVGRGLRDQLPDAAAGKIIDSEMLPLFRRGDLALGIQAGSNAIMGTLMTAQAR